MNKQKLIIVCFLVVLQAGCSYIQFSEEPDIIPENFIVKQNTNQIRSDLEEFQALAEHVVRFKSGQSELSKREQQKLIKWIEDDRPGMIAVRGTGGAKRYKDLGELRGLAVVNFLQTSQVNVDILLLEYNPTLSGGRAIVQSVPNRLALVVRQQAPILIIKSG